MPRDILSRSGSRPQQQLQPALLPDKKGGQRILEGGAALGKLDFHAHAVHATIMYNENDGQHPSLNTFYQMVTMFDISV